MTRRRRRTLSEDERALWSRIAESAEPLERRPAPEQRPAPASGPTRPAASPPPGGPALPQRLPGPRASEPHVSVHWAPDPLAPAAKRQIDRKRGTRLRQGRLEPDASIDLHGMTLAVAHRALLGFVANALRLEHRLLLVVTGKGRGRTVEPWQHAADRGGVLRRNLPIWLSEPPLCNHILDIAPAHQRHGGSGAFYITLRRSRHPGKR